MAELGDLPKHLLLTCLVSEPTTGSVMAMEFTGAATFKLEAESLQLVFFYTYVSWKVVLCAFSFLGTCAALV